MRSDSHTVSEYVPQYLLKEKHGTLTVVPLYANLCKGACTCRHRCVCGDCTNVEIGEDQVRASPQVPSPVYLRHDDVSHCFSFVSVDVRKYSDEVQLRAGSVYFGSQFWVTLCH